MGTTAGCLFIVIYLGVSPVLYILNGWILSVLWRWFIVHLGVQPISVPAAIGIAIVAGFLTRQIWEKHCTDDRTSDDKIIDSIAYLVTSIAYPLIALGIGWIVKSFM